MKFIPYEKYHLKTTLAPNEVLKRLANNIEPTNIFRDNFFKTETKKAYVGDINNNTFEISRVITGRNSWLPIIEGYVTKNEIGSIIHMKMQFHPLVLIFTTLWLGLLCIFLILSVISQITNGKFEPMSLLILPMLMIGYIIPIAVFDGETIQSKRFFKRIFEATEI